MGETFGNAGISWLGLITQLLNFIIFGIWIIGGLWALSKLQRANIGPLVKALWVIVVIVVPAVGAIAFWIVQPGNQGGHGEATGEG